MLDQENAVAEDFRSLKSVTCGGDTVPATLDREFFDMIGRGINQGYGMTEIGICTGAAMATGPVSGSIGTLLPGFEMVFLSPDGTPVADHSIGVAHVRSPTISPGYWQDGTVTGPANLVEWFDTGDLMRIDPDGVVWFEGRQKNIIVHDGANILPSEVESVLCEDPSITDAVVVGVDSVRHGQDVCAFVTVDPEVPHSKEAIEARARKLLGAKAPVDVFLLPSLPLTAAGNGRPRASRPD
jgi:long-chain acyl-CoA synthetase